MSNTPSLADHRRRLAEQKPQEETSLIGATIRDMGRNALGPIGAPFVSDAETQVGRIAQDVQRGLAEGTVAAVQGVGDLAARAGNFVQDATDGGTEYSVAERLGDYAAKLYVQATTGQKIEPGVFEATQEAWKNLSPQEREEFRDEHRGEQFNWLDQNVLSREARPESLQGDTLTQSLTAGFTQFLVPFAGVSRVSSVAKALDLFGKAGVAGRIAGASVVGEGVAFSVFQGDEGRLSDLIEYAPFVGDDLADTALFAWLQTDESDSELEGRMKNLVEGGALGIAADGLLTAFGRAFKSGARGVIGEEPTGEVTARAVGQMAETGEIPASVAEKLGLGWDQPQFNREGPERTRVRQEFLTAGEDERAVNAYMAMSDVIAAKKAAANGQTLDEYYATLDIRGPQGNSEAAGAINSLFQMSPKNPALQVPLSRDRSELLNFAGSKGFAASPGAKVSRTDTLINLERFKQQTAHLSLRDPEQAREFFSHMADPNGDTVAAPPKALMARLNDPSIITNEFREALVRSPDMVEKAAAGFKVAADIRKAFAEGRASPPDVLRQLLWGAQSAMASPFPHEGGALAAFVHPKFDEFAESAIRGEYRRDLAEEITRHALQTGRPGKKVSQNLQLFMLGRGETASAVERLTRKVADGKTGLENIMRIMTDTRLTAQQRRRAIYESGVETHGVGTKIHDFIALVSGWSDALVIDRVRVNSFWDDAEQFGSQFNYYDVGPSRGGLSTLFTSKDDTRVFALIEKIEDELSSVLPQVWTDLDGLVPPELQNLGGYHWLDWVIKSNQSVDHNSMEYIAKRMIGDEEGAIAAARAQEGRYYDIAATAVYHAVPDVMTWRGPFTADFEFLPEDFEAFKRALAKPESEGGVVPDAWVQRNNAWNAEQKTTRGAKRSEPLLAFAEQFNVAAIPEVGNRPWFLAVLDERPEMAGRMMALADEFSVGVHPNGYEAPKPDRAGPDGAATASDSAADGGRQSAASLNQDARGRIDFLDTGRTVINLFESADGSTAVHELGHLFRRSLNDIDPELASRFNAWVGAKDGETWTRAQEEQFAKGFELYVSTGEVPNPELKDAFETLKSMVREAYQNMVHLVKTGQLNVKIKPEVRDMFDELFADPFAKADITSPRPSDRPPNTPLPAAQDTRASYLKGAGMTDAGPQPYVRVDTTLAGRIADAYDDLQHNPSDPAVKESYDALAAETQAQYEHVVNSGTRFVFTSGDPYTSSQGLIDDIEANGRMRVFRTEEGSLPADHPLAAKTGIMATDAKTGEQFELVYNDLFRAVHDYFGHAAGGYQFGARGEENAWVAHSRMYSEKARPAMTTETRGQNSWVNTNRTIRRADGTVPRKGDPDYVNPKDRPFAQQKAGLLPGWALEHPDLTPASRDADLTSGLQKTLFQLKDKLDVSGLGRFHLAVASHTNVAKLQTSSDARAFIVAVDNATQGKIDDLIGDVQTLDEVLQEAAARGLDPEQLRRDLAKGAANVQRLPSLIVAGRAVKAGLAEQLNKAAADVLAGKPGAIQSMIDLENALARVDTQVGVLTKEAARATGSGRITVPGINEAAATAIAKAMSERQAVDAALLGAADAAAQKGDSALAAYLRGQAGATGDARAKKFARMIQDAQAVGKVDSAIRKARESRDPTIVDAFLEAYKAYILSGVRTFSINVLSGGLQTYMQATARILGAGTRLGTPGGRRDFRNASRYMIQLHASMFDVVGMLAMNRSFTGGFAPNLRQSAANTVKQESPNLYGTIQQAGGITSATESKKAIAAETFGLESDQAVGKAVNGIGRLVRLPFLVSMLGEEWWSTINYLAFIRTKALDQADAIWDDTTLTQAEKHKAVAAFVQDYTSKAFNEFGSAARLADGSYSHAEAVRYAQSANFMQDLEYGMGELILEAKRNPKYGAGPITDLILPFVKAPTNLIRTAARYSIGGAAVLRRTKGAPPLAQWEADKNRGEMILGGMLMTAAALLASEGAITGGGPVNADEREILQQSGWRPYSFVRVGADGRKQYIQFNRFDPQASVFGLVADMVEVIPYLNPEEADQAVAKALTGVAQNFASKTYLRNLTESFQAITRPERFGKKFLQNMAANLVPFSSMGRSINATNSEYMLETYTFLDMVKQRIPGMAADLPPRRNIFGEPITPLGGYIPFTSGETAVGKMASPAAFSRETDDEAIQEMARLQAGFSMPGVTIDGVDITRYQTRDQQNAYDRYLELAGTIRANGKTQAQAVNALIKSPNYRRLPEPTGDPKQDAYNPRVRAIKTVMDGYRDAARAQLLREIPELREEIRRRKLGGMTGTRRPGPSNSLDVIDRLLQ